MINHNISKWFDGWDGWISFKRKDKTGEYIDSIYEDEDGGVDIHALNKLQHKAKIYGTKVRIEWNGGDLCDSRDRGCEFVLCHNRRETIEEMKERIISYIYYRKEERRMKEEEILKRIITPEDRSVREETLRSYYERRSDRKRVR